MADAANRPPYLSLPHLSLPDLSLADLSLADLLLADLLLADLSLADLSLRGALATKQSPPDAGDCFVASAPRNDWWGNDW